MTSPIVGRGVIQITPDFSLFRTQYNAFLASLPSQHTVNVNVQINNASLAAANARIAATTSHTVNINPNVNHNQFSIAGAAAAGSFNKGFAQLLTDILPGRVGPQMAAAIGISVIAAAPAIAGTISSAVALGVGAVGVGAGIAIAFQDPRIKTAGKELATSIGDTLREAALPFTSALAVAIPKLGRDIKSLEPQIAAAFAPFAPVLDKLEHATLTGLTAALPGIEQASKNAAQFLDVLAAKAPEIGAAFGEALSRLTDTASLGFFSSLIDFINAAVVDIAKFIEWLSKINQELAPLEAALGKVFTGFLSTLGSVLGPLANISEGIGPINAAILATGAILVVLQAKFGEAAVSTRALAVVTNTAADAQARLNLVDAFAARALAEKIALQTNNYAQLVQTTAATERAAVAAERLAIAEANVARATLLAGTSAAGAARTALLAKAGMIAAFGAILAGSALAGQEGGAGIAGGVLTGAGTGALLGSLAGPWGAAAGAIGGAAIGGFSAVAQQNRDSADKFSTSIGKLAEVYKTTGNVSSEYTNILSRQDKVLKDLSEHSTKYGTTVENVTKAVGSGNISDLDREIATQESIIRKVNAKRDAGPKNAFEVLKYFTPADVIDRYKEDPAITRAKAVLKPLQEAREEAAKTEAAQGGLNGLWAHGEQKARELAAAALLVATAYRNINQAASDYAAKGSAIANALSPPQFTVPAQAYYAYRGGEEAVDDSVYNYGITKAQVNQANISAATAVGDAQHSAMLAARGTRDAEYGLVQAHKATIAAEKNLIQTAKDLTAARKEATETIVDQADKEEASSIAVERAKRVAYARGEYFGPLETETTIRNREAKLNLHEALTADARLKAIGVDLKKQGVEGAPSVVAAKDAHTAAGEGLKDALHNEAKQREAVSDAQYTQSKSALAVRDAVRRQTETQAAGNRQLLLGNRAIRDAIDSLDGPGGLTDRYRIARDQSGLTTAQIRDGLIPQLTAINHDWRFSIDGDPSQANEAISSVYSRLQGVGKALGIDLPDLLGGVDLPGPSPAQIEFLHPTTFAPHLPTKNGVVGPWAPGTEDKAEGGLINGPYIGPKADNVVIRANPREFVEPVHAVDYYGANTFEALRLHQIPREALAGYAAGGQVMPPHGVVNPSGTLGFGKFDTPMTELMKRWLQPSIDAINAISPQSSGGGALQGGDIANWLRTTVDPLPYIFGNVGPSSYDCSGLVGEVAARVLGINKGYQRYFSTGDEESWLTKHGFHSGAGQFTVGFNDHHTMGRLGNLSFEAANSKSGIHVGTGTSDVMSFDKIMGLDNIPGIVNAPTPDSVKLKGVFGDGLRKMLTRAAEIASYGGDTGIPDSADANVANIAATTGRTMGADYKAMLALFEAGLVESGMRNLLKATDHDSLGYLQQRPSAGWPDPTNVQTATRSFLKKAMRYEPWEGSAGSLAQKVQVSAYPSLYDKRQASAAALLAQYGFVADNGATLPPHSTSLVTNNTSQPEHVGFGLTLDEMRQLALLIAQALQSQPADLRLKDESVIAEKVIKPAINQMISMSGVTR